MSDDRWRDTYDAWKTRLPDYADGRVCERCGGWLYRGHCADCEAPEECEDNGLIEEEDCFLEGL